jgi:hypothetical protein
VRALKIGHRHFRSEYQAAVRHARSPEAVWSGSISRDIEKRRRRLSRFRADQAVGSLGVQPTGWLLVRKVGEPFPGTHPAPV